MKLVDYSGGYPGAAAIKNAGYAGAIRYLVNSPDRGLVNKKTTRAEVIDFQKNGLVLVSNWQRGKGPTADFRRGRAGGVADGRDALAAHFEVGGPGFTPIYFSVDEDVDLNTWNFQVLPWLEGIASVIGKQWVGVYGGQRSMWWAQEDGFRWRWQTLGWSRYDANGNWNSASPVQWVDGVNIRQTSIDSATIGWVGVDTNETMTADFGQWGLDRNQPAEPQQPTTGGSVDYGVTKTILAGTDGRRDHDDFVGLHTQEGGTGDAVGLANFCKGAGVSYNAAVDDVDTVLMVPVTNAPWAAVQANDYGVHICFAGSYVAWSKDRWLSKDASDGLDEDAMLWRGARFTAAACQQFNIPTEWVGNNGTTGWPTKRGICGHKDFGSRGGGHTDPYPNFPVDEFMRRVRSFFGPAVNLIEQEAKVAAGWIGKRLSAAGAAGESVIRGVAGREIGRFVAYENGHIYWKTGANLAYAIPHGGLFEAYAARGWEAGLGFPLLRHASVTGGGVQSFEGGVLMVQTGGDPKGRVVHGEIGKYYAANGWEQGRFGWPLSDEISHSDSDNISQRFEHGTITWSPTGIFTTMGEA